MPVAKFVKKPVVVEAIQFTESSAAEVLRFMNPELSWQQLAVLSAVPVIPVNTNHGQTDLKHGDWLIKGPGNEFYPCSDSVFRTVYEEMGPIPQSSSSNG